MRDPERIDRIVERLRKIWHERPDLRLGQMIVNAVGEDRAYQVEDDRLIDAVELVHGRIDKARLDELADEGLRLRREMDERIRRMRTLTAEDLSRRSD